MSTHFQHTVLTSLLQRYTICSVINTMTRPNYPETFDQTIKGLYLMKTLLCCICFVCFVFIIPAHASISPASLRHNSLIQADDNTITSEIKPPQKKPLIVITDGSGKTYFIFNHKIAGRSWLVNFYFPNDLLF